MLSQATLLAGRSRAHLRCCILAAAAVPLLAVAAPAAPPPAFRIVITEPGVYRVAYEDLRQAGLAAADVDSSGLAVAHRGEAVPIWIADGGDGRFGPGDHLELIGERLAGDRSTYNEHTRLNVYRLAIDQLGGSRMTSPAPPADRAARRRIAPASLAATKHLEEDLVLQRFAGYGGKGPEPWFWARVTHADPKPFRHTLRLEHYRPDPRRPMSLTVELKGWSTAGRRLSEPLPDHRVEVSLNGRPVGAGEWNGRESHRVEVPAVPADLARRGANVLEIRVPPRRPTEEADPIIDAVVLNWIEVRYPRRPRVEAASRFVLGDPPPEGGAPDDHGPAKVRLTTDPGQRLVVYGDAGSRFDAANSQIEDRAGHSAHVFYPSAGESAFHAVPGGELRTPEAVELDRPSDLRNTERRADYIMIAHPRLLEAIEPLAAFHRRRGLAVEVVAVDDVYDEFNHSILDPAAIRDFLSHAYHRWQSPAPRFVLLVGDASWKSEEVAPPGAETEGGTQDGEWFERNLVPTGVFSSFKGRAASDNYFVDVDGDDRLPDMAIGRFPVTEPREVAAIVEKTLRYAGAPAVGPWRRDVLWLSSADRGLQKGSDAVFAGLTASGLASRKIYPSNDPADNEQTQEDLLAALDGGQLLVHFFGHGGRFIWRTGNPDHKTRLDLFTLDHLDRLAPNDRLPLVMSMTCFSAPFDHPTRDSIGEKFLRLPGRGAIAVLGASWKASPIPRYSTIAIEELRKGGTIGEAIQRAKRRVISPGFVEIYNLLGDPAIELALPRLAVEVTARETDGRWEVTASLPEEGFAGRAIVDWLDDAGQVVASDELEVGEAAFTVAGPAAGDAVEAVRVYVWNEEAGVDGMGFLDLPAEATAQVPSSDGDSVESDEKG